MNELPIIRLEIEEMCHQVLHQLGMHHEEIERVVAERVKHVVDTFDYVKAVDEAAQRALRDHVGKAVEEAVRSVMWSKEAREYMRKLAGKAIADMDQ